MKGKFGKTSKSLKILSNWLRVTFTEEIFNRKLFCALYPDDWKKCNVVLIHEKKSENLIKNYRPIILLPVFTKVIDVKGIFLDIWKAFLQGRAWWFNLQTHVVWCRKQNPEPSVKIIWQTVNKVFCQWANIRMNYHTSRSITRLCFRRFLFFYHINDLSESLKSTCKIFADDPSLFSKIKDLYTNNTNMNNDLIKISWWLYQWKMLFNPDRDNDLTVAKTPASNTWVFSWLASLVSIRILIKKSDFILDYN